MTVTFAIPIYNGARYLAETIRSILNQSDRDLRIVCIDDASTDDSVSVARSFDDARVSIVVAEHHSSLAGNWNRALDYVDTDYFVIAHQDDLYEPDYLVTMRGAIDSRPRAFAVHCKTLSIDACGRVIHPAAARYKETFWPANNPYEREPSAEIAVLSRGNYVVAPSVMMRTSAARQIGRFDSSLQFVTDWEYWLRGLAAGFTLAGVQQRLVRFRRHPGTATRATELSFRRYDEELEMVRRLSGASFRAVLNTLTADFAARLAAGDRDGARSLLEFGGENIPGFTGSLRMRAMRIALASGSLGGHALNASQRAFIELAIVRNRLTS